MPPTTHLSPPSSKGQPSHRNKRKSNARRRERPNWSGSYALAPRKVARSEDHVELVAEVAVVPLPASQRSARCSGPRSCSRRRIVELVEEVAIRSCSPSRVLSTDPSPAHAHEEKAVQQCAHGCPASRQTSVCLKSDLHVTTKCQIHVCPCQQVDFRRGTTVDRVEEVHAVHEVHHFEIVAVAQLPAKPATSVAQGWMSTSPDRVTLYSLEAFLRRSRPSSCRRSRQ